MSGRPAWTSKEARDRSRYGLGPKADSFQPELFDAGHNLTPCRMAWQRKTVRENVGRWLAAGASAGREFRVQVVMPGGVEMEARYQRGSRIVQGILWHCAIDPDDHTIYVSRRPAR